VLDNPRCSTTWFYLSIRLFYNVQYCGVVAAGSSRRKSFSP
jgi:hypothetical protein